MNTRLMKLLAWSCLGNLLLSNTKKRKPNRLRLPSFPRALEVRSAIPGRIRFNVPLLKNNPELSSELKGQLLKIAAVKEAAINTVTGTMLIVYNRDELDPRLLQGALIKLLGLEDTLRDGAKSVLGREIKTIRQALNYALLDKSKGLLDLRSTLAVSLILLGAWQIYRQPLCLPTGYTLLWWGMHKAFSGESEE